MVVDGVALVVEPPAEAVEEVAEVGFEAATMESIAARASAGKASLYKRWASLDALVLDALAEAAGEGRTVVVATHDPAVVARADEGVRL